MIPENFIHQTTEQNSSSTETLKISTPTLDESKLAYIFAPELRLHSEELYFPASVEWYLKKCELRFSTGALDLDPVILDSIPDFDTLLKQSYRFNDRTFYSMQTPMSPNHSPFYLRVKDQSAIFGEKDNLSQVPVYVRFFYPEDKTLKYVDIQYYFFYGYNGALKSFLPTVGIHEGDWEHITIRVRLDGIYNQSSIMAIYFSAHGGEGRWYLNCAGKEGDEQFVPTASLKMTEDTGRGIGYYLNKDGHPIVYSSKFLHASYPTASRQRRFVPLGLIDDFTDDKGLYWQTWNTIVLMPDTSTICHIDKSFDPENPLSIRQEPFKSILDIRWLLFNGQWGRKGRKSYGESDGPYGPGMKTYFRKGDVGITLQNCIGHAPGNAGIWNASKQQQTQKTVQQHKPQNSLTCRFNSDSFDEGLCFELKVFSKSFVEVE